MNVKKLYSISFTVDTNSFNERDVLVDQNSIRYGLEKSLSSSIKEYADGNVLTTSNKIVSHGLFVYGGDRRTAGLDIRFSYNELTSKDLQDAKFYRTSKLSLPQTKLQILKDKYNVKIVRDKLKADYIISSDKFAESLVQYDWYGCAKYETAFNHIRNLKNHFSETIYLELLEFLNYVKSQNGFIKIVADDWPWGTHRDVRNKFINGLRDHDNSFYWIKDYDFIEYIKNNPNIIVSDTHMVNHCNVDSVTLTNQDCKSISQMIKSNDKLTIALALEMMANCNIEKSYDKIALIFAFYDDIIRYATNWNSVNVKSLRRVMQDVNSIDDRYGMGFSNLVKHLKQKGHLTNFAIGAISNKMCKTILSYAGLTNDESVFDIKPKDLKLKPEYEANELPF